MNRPLRIFMTGATGLVGRRLVLDRLERGDHLVLLSRDARRAERLFAARANPNVRVVGGDPSCPGPWQDAVSGSDVVIHLAGAGVAARRWTAAYRREIIESRIDSTHQVVEAIAGSAERPRVLLNASAIGFYGETGDETIDEHHGKGNDFLADLAGSWEDQALRAGDSGETRIVLLRTGLVLDGRGGMLASLVRPFRLFIGGPLGNGRQYVSWIHHADVVGLIDHAMRTNDVRGPLNLVAPNPVTNRDFSAALARVLHRPNSVPLPAVALRLALGPFAHYALMSQRVVPGRAERTGYVFRFPQIASALEDLVGRSRSADAAPPVIEVAAPIPGPTERALPAPTRRPRLIVVSTDGALLRADRTLPTATVHAVRAAQRAGVVVMLATSRAPRVIAPLARTLELEGPVIAYNGAVIWSPLDREARFHQPLGSDVASRVIEIVRAAAPEVRIAIEVLDHWFTDRFVVGPGPSAGTEPDEVGPLERFLSEPVSQIDIVGAREDIANVRSRLGATIWREGLVAVFDPTSTGLQVVHPRADKGIAVQRVADRLGAHRDQVVAIGGALTDAGLLEWAGFSYALAAAPARLLAQADARIGDPRDAARVIHAVLQTAEATTVPG